MTTIYPILRRRANAAAWPIERLFDNAFFGGEGVVTPWMPEVDVRENEEAILVQVDLPGMTREEVAVKLENGVLSISGERSRQTTEGDSGSYHVAERRYGKFTRTFSLPDAVDAEKIRARFANGVLEVELPKVARARPRTVEIDVEAR